MEEETEMHPKPGRAQTTVSDQNLPARPWEKTTGSPVRRSARRTRSNKHTIGRPPTPERSEMPSNPGGEETPRAPQGSSSRVNTSIAATSAQYSRSLYTVFDPPSIPSSRSSRSSPSKHSSRSGRLTSPVKSMAALREAGITYAELEDSDAHLGNAGDSLYQELDDVKRMLGVYPEKVFEDILAAHERKHRVLDIYKDMNDHRTRDQLLSELTRVRKIKRLSSRCSKDLDGEAEWNNAVHSAVLRLALGSEDDDVGWRYITNAKIDTRYLPAISDGLSTAPKMVDYAVFIGDRVNTSPHPHTDASQSCIRINNDIQKLILEWSDSINHISYIALRHRPIFIGIETKTISRTEEEARVQLGVWVSAHVNRIWALRNGLSQSGTESLRRTLLEMAFPLIYIQSAKWYLMLARPVIANAEGGNQWPEVVIYHDIQLGETSSIDGIYQLLRAFRVIRKWGDGVFRAWWRQILNIVCQSG